MNGDQIRTIVEAVQQALEDRRELAGLSRRSELQPRCFRCGVVHGSQRCPFAVRVRRQRRRPRRGYRRSRNAGRFAISHHRRRPPSSTDGSSTRPNSPRCTCIDCPIHGLLARYSSPAAPASPPPAVIIPSTPASPEPNDGQDAPILERWERYELVSESSDNGNDAEVEAESDEGLQNPSGASMSREMAEDK